MNFPGGNVKAVTSKQIYVIHKCNKLTQNGGNFYARSTHL